MIKFIKKWVCKIFHIKQCKCGDKDKIEKQESQIINETAKQKKIRLNHKGSE